MSNGFSCAIALKGSGGKDNGQRSVERERRVDRMYYYYSITILYVYYVFYLVGSEEIHLGHRFDEAM